MDIVNNRSNANKLLGRLLFDLRERNTYSVLHMEEAIRIMLYLGKHLLSL